MGTPWKWTYSLGASALKSVTVILWASSHSAMEGGIPAQEAPGGGMCVNS